MNDRNVTSANFLQVNHLLQIDSHLTAKLYVDNSIDESRLVGSSRDSDFNKKNLTNRNSITLNKPVESDNKVVIKAYVDHFHNDNEKNRRDLGLDFYDESSDLVKKQSRQWSQR